MTVIFVFSRRLSVFAIVTGVWVAVWQGGNVYAIKRFDCFEKNTELLVSDFVLIDAMVALQMTIEGIHPSLIVWVQMIE